MNKKKKPIEGRPTSELEVDENLLTPEQKEAYKLKFPLGLLIFIIVVAVLIVAFSIVIMCI